MRKFIYIILLLLCIIPFSGCEKSAVKQPGEKMSYPLVFEFNKEAKQRGDWLVFRLECKDPEQLKLFDVKVEGAGKVPVTFDAKKKSAEFKIVAGQGKTSVNNSLEEFNLILQYKEGLKKYPEHQVLAPKLKIIEASPNFQNEVSKLEGAEYYPSSEDGTMADLENSHVTITGPPTPAWQIWGGILLAVLIVGAAGFYILKLPNMPLGPKTFKVGMLTFPNADAKVMNVRLEKLEDYSLNSAFEGLEEITLVPTDKKYKGKNGRYARLKNSSIALKVKVIYDGQEEMVGSFHDLLHMDEIKVIDTDGKEYLFKYSNIKNRR